MSETPRNREIGPLLDAWMEDVAPRRAPEQLLEEAFARTMATRQVRRYPWNGLVPPRRGDGSPAAARRLPIALVAACLVAVLGFALGAGGLHFPPAEGPSASPTVTPSPTTPVGSASPSFPLPVPISPEATIAVNAPITLVSDGTAVWVLTPGHLVRIDPANNAQSGSIELGSATDLYNDLAASRNGLWISDWDADLVYRVDPRAAKVVGTIHAGVSPKGLLATDVATWVANTHAGSVSRVDPATNNVVATINVGPIGTSGPNWLAASAGSVWVGIPNGGSVVRIDSSTDKVLATIPVPPTVTPCGGLAAGDTAVWIPSCDNGPLMARIDPISNTVVATVDLGGNGYAPMLFNGVPWISVAGIAGQPGRLVRIDPASNSIDRLFSLGADFGGGGNMIAAAGSLWIVDGASNRVIRVLLSAVAP